MTFQRDRYWQDNIKDKGRLDARADKDFLWENLARLRETRPAGSALVCCSICIGSYSGDQGESKRWGRVWPTFLLRGEKSFLLRLVALIRFLKLWLQVHAVDVTAKLRGGDSTEVDFFTDSKYFSLWQNSLQVFQLIIKSQPVNEDTRKFLQPNRTFEKEVALGEKTKTLAFGV